MSSPDPPLTLELESNTNRLTNDKKIHGHVAVIVKWSELSHRVGWIHVFIAPSASRAAAASAITILPRRSRSTPFELDPNIHTERRKDCPPLRSSGFLSMEATNRTEFCTAKGNAAILNLNRTTPIVSLLQWRYIKSQSDERRMAWSRNQSSLACCRG